MLDSHSTHLFLEDGVTISKYSSMLNYLFVFLSLSDRSALKANTTHDKYSRVQFIFLASLSASVCVVCLHTDSFKPNSIHPNANSNELFPLRAI